MSQLTPLCVLVALCRPQLSSSSPLLSLRPATLSFSLSARAQLFLSQVHYLHEIRSLFVDEGAESQTVPERGGHVGDGHVSVALTLDPAPLLQSLHGRHPAAQSPHTHPHPETETETQTDELVLEPSVSARADSPPPSHHRQHFTNFPQKLGPAGSGEVT